LVGKSVLAGEADTVAGEKTSMSQSEYVNVPWLLLAGGTFIGMCGLLMHVILFRRGSAFRFIFGAGGMFEELDLKVGYALLPSSIGVLLLTGGMVADQLLPLSNSGERIVAIVLAISFLAAGGWAIKEFFRPTLRRTPSWLIDEMKSDERLNVMICGRRPLPGERYSAS